MASVLDDLAAAALTTAPPGPAQAARLLGAVAGLLETVGALTEPGDDVAVLATYTSMLDFRRAVLGSRAAQV